MMCNAVGLVFQTMAHRDVRVLRHELTSGPPPEAAELGRVTGPVVVGTVGFVGRANGFVYLHFSESFARQLTSDILGLSPAEIDREGFDMVKDTIAELTNVVAGTFKNQLCARGLGCHLTIPSILHGPPFQIEDVTKTSRWVFEFETRGVRFVADVLCDHIV